MSLAFLFPGQGSQSIGMLAGLAERYPGVAETFAEASQAVGFDLWALIQEGPEEQLNKTHITQPAILTASVAIWRIWLSEGGRTPTLLAGHSLGEYSALVCAGSLDFAETVAVVSDRGRYMQQAVPPGEGAMAALLGLDDEVVVAVCEEAAQGEVLSAVNFNSPGQVVVAGATGAVDRALLLAKEKGSKRAMRLPVSVPSHCALMAPAAEKLAQRLAEITVSTPAIPVVNNVDVQSNSEADAIRDALVRQLHSPVRWTETIRHLHGEGVESVLECGPGKVLVGLNKRIERTITGMAISNPQGMEQALEQFS